MLTSIAAIIFASFVLGHITARHRHYFGDTPNPQQKPHTPKGKETVK